MAFRLGHGPFSYFQTQTEILALPESQDCQPLYYNYTIDSPVYQAFRLRLELNIFYFLYIIPFKRPSNI